VPSRKQPQAESAAKVSERRVRLGGGAGYEQRRVNLDGSLGSLSQFAKFGELIAVDPIEEARLDSLGACSSERNCGSQEPTTWPFVRSRKINVTAEGDLRVKQGGLSVDDRLTALEAEVHEHRAEQRQAIAGLEKKTSSMTDIVQAATMTLEGERKQRLVKALGWEEAGVWTFILGVILTVVGTVT
jgi:hypothetical protein